MSKIPSCLVFCSGKGSTLSNIIDKIETAYLNIQIECVVSTSETAGCIQIAKNKGLGHFVISKDLTEGKLELIELLDKLSPDFIILAGFMRKIPEEIIKKFNNRILNIHPSLLPEFGGQGMYGMNVHKAVIEQKKKESGSTVHIVTENYDEGPIIASTKIEVLTTDTAESLCEKVKNLENELYPIAINIFIQEYLKIPVIFKLSDFSTISHEPILAIFGGTFDPIHEGHISDIKNLMTICKTIIIAPTSQNPWKERGATDLNKRLEMIELALKYEKLDFSYDLNNKGLIVSKEPYVYATEFLKNISANRKYSEKKYWAIGEDLVEKALEWKSWNEEGISFISLPLLPNTSSTKVRSGNNKSHPALENYIKDNSLYA